MFTEEELQLMIDRKMIGHIYPYDTNDEKAVIDYTKQIKAELERQSGVHVRVEQLHFGSGYASYIEWFVYLDRDVQQSDNKYGIRTVEKEGLMINISLLAPVILIGTGEKSDDILIETDKVVGGSKSLFCEVSNLDIPAQFKELANSIEGLFMKYHYTILQKADVNRRLPIKTYIPTIFREPYEYLVWDAIFYWED